MSEALFVYRDGERVGLSPAEAADFEGERPVAPPAPRRMIAKTSIYRRATDAELAAIDSFMRSGATTRQRLMWQDAEAGLVLVDDVLPIAEGLFGSERAAALLAPLA